MNQSGDTPASVHANHPQGMVPDGLSDETRVFFQSLIESFNKSAEDLKEAYQQLQVKFDHLNRKLEQTNAELSESLAEQERLSNYLTNILESVSSGVLAVDADGVITLFNRGAEHITGIRVEDAIGRFYIDVMGDDVPRELTPLGALQTGVGRTDIEKTVASVCSGTVPVGCSVSPLTTGTGELFGAVEVFMDLTRIKALEDELAWKEKLAALGRMSATMAHKIRNPLGGIVGYAGLMQKRLREDETSTRQVGKIIAGVEKIEHIISSVLTYNAPLNLMLRELSLGERTEELVRQAKLDRSLGDYPHIRYQTSSPAEPVMVEADPDQLSIALQAVMTNAAEAISVQGQIAVSVFRGGAAAGSSNPVIGRLWETMRTSSRLFESGRPCGGIIVFDTGSGMDNEALANLYVPFYTTRENGIGLGLALTRKIINAHHGEIWIESIHGQGTAVGMLIPERSTV